MLQCMSLLLLLMWWTAPAPGIEVVTTIGLDLAKNASGT
jgi:hypothetical protein